ncbi:hypothetical protein JCM10212_005094 [Sporobolomyces blumeae]
MTTSPCLPQTPPEEPLYLSIDAGATKYRACVLDSRLEVVHVEQVEIDTELPEYGTRDGVYTMGDRVTCPSELRLKALDLLLDKLASGSSDPSMIGRVVAVSGSGQPSVLHYLTPTFEAILATLAETPELDVSTMLTADCFSLLTPPAANDTSTLTQVRDLERHFGRLILAVPSTDSTSPPSGSDEASSSVRPSPIEILEAGRTAFAARTGSKPGTRQSAAQLLKIRQDDEAAIAQGELEEGDGILDRTGRIVLESGLLAAVFLGHLAPVDAADACATNLFNPVLRDWDDEVLDFVMSSAGGEEGQHEGGIKLREMLGPVQGDGGVPLGKISSYMTLRFGFSPDCLVVPFTGTDAASFLSFPLESSSTRRDALVSLSTADSDSVLVPAAAWVPHPERSIFVHPAKADDATQDESPETPPFVVAVESKHAGLGRTLARDLYCNGAWDVFTRLTAIVPFGASLGLDNKRYSFFFPHGEASIAQGLLRFVEGVRVAEFPDRKANPRLLLESQFMSLRLRLSRAYAALALVKNSPPSAISQLAKLGPHDPLAFPPLSKDFLPTRIVLAGSAAQNPAISSILSTIFDASTFLLLASGLKRESVDGEVLEDYKGRDWVNRDRMKTSSAALGSAYKAAWAHAREGGSTVAFGPFLAGMIERQRIEDDGSANRNGLYDLCVEDDLDDLVDESRSSSHATRHTPRSGSGYTASSIGLSQASHSRNSSANLSDCYSTSTSGFSAAPPPLPPLATVRFDRSLPKSRAWGKARNGIQPKQVDEVLAEDPPGLTLVAMPDEDEFKYYSSMLPEHVRLQKYALRGLI